MYPCIICAIMVAPEIPVIFGLNIPLDLKWCVYDTMWKHVYPIDKELKEQIVNKAMMFIAMGMYRRTFTVTSRVMPLNDNSDRMIRITNNTDYMDALLFDLHVLKKNYEMVHSMFGFSCVIWEHDEELDEDMDEFDIKLFMKQYMTDEEKRKLLLDIWNGFEHSEISQFVDRIEFDEATIFPVDLL